MIQQELNFRCQTRQPVFELTDSDRRYIELCRPKGDVGQGFLAELRCRRLGITRQNFAQWRNYEQALELADEAALVFLPGMEFVRPYRPDLATIDAIAKRETTERMADFEEYRRLKRETSK